MPQGSGDGLNGMPSPHGPLPWGLRDWRAPPAWRRVGRPHPEPTPAPPAQRARRGLRDAATASPRFRGPGPARCARTGLGPGPGARTARGKHLLCTEPGKLSPSLVAFMAVDWGVPAGDGVGGTGLHGRGLFLYFSTPPAPALPSPNSGGGRTDVKCAPLPLPRGRSARLQSGSRALRGGPGDLAGAPREGRADTGGRAVPTPAALRPGPMRSSALLGRLCTCHPGRLVPKGPRSRAAGAGLGCREGASGCVLGGRCLRARPNP